VPEPVVPATLTLQTVGTVTTKPEGTENETSRCVPEVTTAVDWVDIEAPFPEGGVIVTVTLVLPTVPDGKFFAVRRTVPPTVAGVVTGFRTTWAWADTPDPNTESNTPANVRI
jgi:hypothetical protein